MKPAKLRFIYLGLAILNALNILLINNQAHAQALECNLSGVKKTLKNYEIAPTQSCQQTKSLTASTNSGSPALRRIPNQGEQQFEPTRIPLRIPTYRTPYRASPSITIINPSGYGAAAGSAGIGVGFQERVRFKDDADGVIGLGFGFGNPQKNIGLQVGVSLVDVSAPFRDGAINLKLHRRLPNDFSVATGVQGIATWGDTDGGSSVYGVTTKRLVLQQDRSKPFSEIYASVGVGGGQFRLEEDIDDGVESIGVFGSLAVRVIEPINLITEWTGQDLTIGVSVVPFRNIPLVIVPAVTDVTGAAGDGGRVILGVGYSISF
ncbi:MAG: hypothetical protein Kow0049_08850 [Stanieria sp.]